MFDHFWPALWCRKTIFNIWLTLNIIRVTPYRYFYKWVWSNVGYYYPTLIGAGKQFCFLFKELLFWECKMYGIKTMGGIKNSKLLLWIIRRSPSRKQSALLILFLSKRASGSSWVYIPVPPLLRKSTKKLFCF